MTYNLITGNCLDNLKELEDNSVDSIVTDPPYGINFMGKKWDYDVPSVEIWKECLRVLKPGGHLLAFAGTRTQHRMAVNIEDAGFEIRDIIAWVYAVGMPKSHDVSKAIDKSLGAEREVVGKAAGMAKQNPKWNGTENGRSENYYKPEYEVTAPTTEEAKQWQGWGTALKPSFEPVSMARKPLIGTVAHNVLEYGTGGINIDGCRISTDELKGKTYNNQNTGWKQSSPPSIIKGNEIGRWPANFTHDGSEEVLELFPQTGISRGGNSTQINSGSGKYNWNVGDRKATPNGIDPGYGDSGSAARFFYSSKASKTDKNEGLSETVNDHPTVKPTELMRYLCRLVTPPGGTVLDPFMGSGSTGKAALLENFNFIGMEMDENYVKIAEERLSSITPTVTLDALFQ